jgi:hypothetical protein
VDDTRAKFVQFRIAFGPASFEVASSMTLSRNSTSKSLERLTVVDLVLQRQQ